MYYIFPKYSVCTVTFFTPHPRFYNQHISVLAGILRFYDALWQHLRWKTHQFPPPSQTHISRTLLRMTTNTSANGMMGPLFDGKRSRRFGSSIEPTAAVLQTSTCLSQPNQSAHLSKLGRPWLAKAQHLAWSTVIPSTLESAACLCYWPVYTKSVAAEKMPGRVAARTAMYLNSYIVLSCLLIKSGKLFSWIRFVPKSSNKTLGQISPQFTPSFFLPVASF